MGSPCFILFSHHVPIVFVFSHGFSRVFLPFSHGFPLVAPGALQVAAAPCTVVQGDAGAGKALPKTGQHLGDFPAMGGFPWGIPSGKLGENLDGEIGWGKP